MSLGRFLEKVLLGQRAYFFFFKANIYDLFFKKVVVCISLYVYQQCLMFILIAILMLLFDKKY